MNFLKRLSVASKPTGPRVIFRPVIDDEIRKIANEVFPIDDLRVSLRVGSSWVPDSQPTQDLTCVVVEQNAPETR